jgi:hypothetical protein
MKEHALFIVNDAYDNFSSDNYYTIYTLGHSKMFSCFIKKWKITKIQNTFIYRCTVQPSYSEIGYVEYIIDHC